MLIFQVLMIFLNSDDCRGELIGRMKVSRVLPRKEELLKAKGLSEDFIDELFQAHKEYWAVKENFQDSEDQS